MFKSEEKMRRPVTHWMNSMGLSVKAEFITPWGICDLVGSSARKESISKRVKLGQTKHISSLTRAALLLSIPDFGSDEAISLKALARTFSQIIPEDRVLKETGKLLTDGFVCEVKRNRLQRLNGWAPLHKRMVAVELKLNRVEEAMGQACNNLSFADESYVAFPYDVALRVNNKSRRWKHFFDCGVGLLGVTSRDCVVIKKSRHRLSEPDPILQFYCVEKFWTAFIKDS